MIQVIGLIIAKMRPATIMLVAVCLLLTGCPSAPEQEPSEETQSTDSNQFDQQSNQSSEESRRPEVAKDVQLIDKTSVAAIDFTYQNGREAGHNAILESLGGGTAVLDYDLDGQLDVFFTGGGKYDGKKILGLPAALYRNTEEL
ncbi:MAG: hypothetical protein VB857_06035, partial [Pirellulaceae bacterium]